MHGLSNIKFVNAKQAYEAHQYKSTKRKLHNTIAAIWYNKTCREQQLKPKYVSIKNKSNNILDKRTEKMAIRYRINQELKLLYAKKQKLNLTLYKTHLIGAHKWKTNWGIIQATIDDLLKLEAEEHYRKLNNKISRLKQQQDRKTTQQQNKNRDTQQFYNRTENLTHINFSNEERALLDKGLQHSIAKPIRKWWNDTVMETEQAIRKLDPQIQEPYRIIAAQKLQQIKQRNNTKSRTKTEEKEYSTIKSIHKKLNQHNAMITKADKGKTTVIINKEEYNNKVMEFLLENNFKQINKDPTNKYKAQIQKIAKQCETIIPKQVAKDLIPKDPKPPTLKAQIKVHKAGMPIRPVVNSISAPSYNITKHLSKKLNNYLQLDNTYNTQNSTTLAHNIVKVKLNKHHRMLALDIKDLYTNIPIDETIQIAQNRAQKHNDTKTAAQITALLNTVLKQNYFRYEDKIYQPSKGVAMGSPLSGLMAEIFLQHLENTHIRHIMENQGITLYTRYVDDILIIYDNRRINAEYILNHANKMHPNIKFDLTTEENNQIHFLDLKLIRLNERIEIDIHRKPTTTDTTIHNPQTTHTNTKWQRIDT